MSSCKGDLPIATKVDGPTREMVDELADDAGISRSEVLRRLLDLYHQSEGGELRCPACTQPVRIRADKAELTTAETNHTSIGTRIEPVSIETGTGTDGSEPETKETAHSSVPHSRVNELESQVESQQQTIESVQQELRTQENRIREVDATSGSDEQLHDVEEHLEWVGKRVGRMVPRIEALTEVSELAESGHCPECGGELTVEDPFTLLGGTSAVECSQCGVVLGYKK